jgi:hypothetical protein
MNMVWAYRTLYDHNIPALTDLTKKIPETHRNLSSKNFEPVLRHPDHVVLYIPNRVGILSVLDHPTIIQHRCWKLSA